MRLMRLRAFLVPVFLVVTVLLLSVRAHAGATIVIVNQNAPGEGFNDATPANPIGGNTGATIGAQRLIAFQFAADIWGATLDSTVEILVHARFIPQSCTATSATLGSAGAAQILSDFPNAAFPGTWYSIALANKRAGSDQLPNSHDINANFNSNLGTANCFTDSGWYYGLDNNQPASLVNLVAVVLHELAHGLGFQQFTDVSTGIQIQDQTDIYARHIFDLTQNKFWNEMSNEQRVQSAINTGNVVWIGAQVSATAPSVLSGTPNLQITAPPAISGAYTIGTAAFGAALTGSPINGNLLMALDPADGLGPSNTDACSAITNGANIAGKIAVVDRGDCNFTVKAKNVQNAGALGVVIINNVAGSTPPGLGGEDATVTIPAVSVTQTDGNAIRAQLAVPTTVTGFLALNLNKLAGADTQGRPLLNAPNPVQPGSSISHWDPQTSPNQLMEPNINDDLTHSVKSPQDLTLALFLDIGWSAATTGTISLSPAALAFGNRLIGYGSFSQNATLSNSTGLAVNIASVVVSGNGVFSRTHDCPPSLAAAASCTIIVVFNPTLGLQSGTLTISSSASNSPHSLSISGTGIADLAFSLSRPKRPARTDSGQSSSTTFELTITPAPGFTERVVLSCAADGGLTCAVQPGTVLVTGAPVSTLLTVKVPARSLRLRRRPVTETRIIRLTAIVGNVTRVVELPVQITR